MRLEEKIKRAVKLLRSFGKDKVVEVSYSGGKDSDVILELVKMAGIDYRAIYKNTTIDPPPHYCTLQKQRCGNNTPKRKVFRFGETQRHPNNEGKVLL